MLEGRTGKKVVTLQETAKKPVEYIHMKLDLISSDPHLISWSW